MNAPDDPSRWTCVRRVGDRRRIEEAALVLTALDIDNHIEREGFEWCLWTPAAVAVRAAEQLEKHRRENQDAPERVSRLTIVDSGWAGVLGYLGVIWLLPSLEASAVFGWDWREAGVMHAGSVMNGEWWRTITALTLHGDLGHILGNSLFGAVFGMFVGRYLGSGFGWLLVLASGAAGNALNAWIEPDAFRSLGASTATFAALGLVAAFVWRRGYFHGKGWRRSFAPIFAAIALLAYTGVGGANTDILAHFFGFAAGVVSGLVAAAFDLRRLGRSGQYLCGAAALLLIALAWSLAGGR